MLNHGNSPRKSRPKSRQVPGQVQRVPSIKGRNQFVVGAVGVGPQMSHPGKRQLEGVERVQGPSSNQHQTRPKTETIKRDIPGGRGITNKE